MYNCCPSDKPLVVLNAIVNEIDYYPDLKKKIVR